MGLPRRLLGFPRIGVEDVFWLGTLPPRYNRRTWGRGKLARRDAQINIENEELTVNGKAYGRLQTGDRVLVDHGVVSTKRAS